MRFPIKLTTLALVCIFASVGFGATLAMLAGNTTTVDVQNAIDLSPIASTVNMYAGEEHNISMTITNNNRQKTYTSYLWTENMSSLLANGINISYWQSGSLLTPNNNSHYNLDVPMNQTYTIIKHIKLAWNATNGTYNIVTHSGLRQD